MARRSFRTQVGAVSSGIAIRRDISVESNIGPARSHGDHCCADPLHDEVRDALIADGWTITHNPFELFYGDDEIAPDPGAERLLAAENGIQQIIVEVKSLRARSFIHTVGHAIGRTSCTTRESPHRLWLAIADEAASQIDDHPAVKLPVTTEAINVANSTTVPVNPYPRRHC